MMVCFSEDNRHIFIVTSLAGHVVLSVARANLSDLEKIIGTVKNSDNILKLKTGTKRSIKKTHSREW